MSTVQIIISIIGLFITAFFILDFMSEAIQNYKINKNDRALRDNGITPCGSSLAHGMCVNRKTGELVSDQKESIMWYKRLL